MKKDKNFLFAFIVLFALIAMWYVFTPHNYDDCILMRLPQSVELAAHRIERACISKFPESYKEHKKLFKTGI